MELTPIRLEELIFAAAFSRQKKALMGVVIEIPTVRGEMMHSVGKKNRK